MVIIDKPKPFLKWVGGKTRLMKRVEDFFPIKYNTYIEPFLGGGSVFFNFTPRNAIISDLNEALINTYMDIRDNFNELYEYLTILEKKNNEEDFYKLRKLFNELRLEENAYLQKNADVSNIGISDTVYISALIIYLNKAGYWGFLLSNSNTEFIKELYKNFKIVEVSVGRYINNKNIKNDRDNNIKNEVLIFNYSKEEEKVKECSELLKEIRIV
jgi:DNA adenine methylase